MRGWPRSAGRDWAAGGGEGRSAGVGGGRRPARPRGAGPADRDGSPHLLSFPLPARLLSLPPSLPPARFFSRPEQAPASHRCPASSSSSLEARGAPPRAPQLRPRSLEEGCVGLWMLLLGVVGAAVGRVAGSGGDSLGFRGLLFLVLLFSLFPVWPWLTLKIL